MAKRPNKRKTEHKDNGDGRDARGRFLPGRKPENGFDKRPQDAGHHGPIVTNILRRRLKDKLTDVGWARTIAKKFGIDALGMGGKELADLLADTMINHAIKGKSQYMTEVINRVEGKVPDRIAGVEGEPLIKIIKVDAKTAERI